MRMDNTPPPENADDRLHTDSVSPTSAAHPQVAPLRPNQEPGDNVSDEIPSVPGTFNVNFGLQDAASQLSESNVPGFRSFVDDGSTERSPNTEAGTSNGVNANDVKKASKAGSLNIADREQLDANVSSEEVALSSSKRCCPVFRSSFQPPKRRWNSGPTPPLDSPDFEQDVVAAAAQQQYFRQPPLPFEQEYPEPVDEQNTNAQNGNAEVASNYLFLSTTHYSSNRVLPFHFHDDRYFSGRINITGFQNVPIIVWPSEVHMEFASETFANNANDELYHYASGIITFPAAINLQNFICWIDGNYLCFQAMIL